MRRQVSGLNRTSSQANLPEGLYLARVQSAQYRWHKHKPYFALSFYVLEPKECLGGLITARLDCSSKALWKLGWFLRDFGYSQELLDRDELDSRALVGLTGVVRISTAITNGVASVDLDAFAPAADWERLAPSRSPQVA